MATRTNANGQVSLTYGKIPSKATFIEHYRARAKEDGHDEFEMRGNYGVDDGTYDEDEVWEIVKYLARDWRKGDEEAGDTASAILSVLGIEWI